MNSFELSHDPFGRLVLCDAAGTRHVDVEPVRAFPFTERDRFVSLRNAQGKEIVFIESLADLPAATRRVVEEELAAREFIPVIRRIVRIVGDGAPMSWDVETDRGAARFVMNNEDDIRRISFNTLVVVDSSGGRYFIPNAADLDAHSRRLLEWAM